MRIDVDPEQDFHVVIDGAAKALSLDELAEAYQADAISDETLIWQDGFDGWMRLDALLAILGEEEEPAVSVPRSAADQGKYQVLVAPEEIKNMTLQTLVDAQRLEVVDDETLVRKPGESEWVPLAVVIAEFAMQARASLPPSQAPTQRAPIQQAPIQQAPAQHAAHQANAYQPPPAPAPVAVVASPPAQNSAPNTFAPTASNVGPASQGFRISPNPAPALDDLDFPEFQKPKSVWVKRSLMGVAALAAVFAVYQGTRDSAVEVAAQPVGARAPSEPAVPAAEAEAEPSAWDREQALLEEARKKDEAAAKEAANSPTANAFGASLGGGSKPSAPTSAPAKSRPQKPKAKQSSSANTGKSQYDPMNGTL